MDYFPENTITHYTTKLSQPINLDSAENWEVGICEFQYPHIWNNINNTNNTFSVRAEKYKLIDASLFTWKKCTIPEKDYENVNVLLDIMNAEIRTVLKMTKYNKERLFYYDPVSKKISYEFHTIAPIRLGKPLTHMFGFDVDEITLREKGTAPFPVDLHGCYSNMYIYSDVLTYQLVGDVSAPLLRVITTKGKKGETIRKSFDTVHYYPVSKSSFETIEIDIRTDTGQPMPFIKGRVYVVLHFKRKK